MNKETILVVDDEEDILELISFHLRRAGYNVTGAVTGEAAWSTINENPVDLLILDLMLPGMDGPGVDTTIKAL
jgi:DNA-binding response OmpR family regulator